MKTILHVFYGKDFAGGASFSMADLCVGINKSKEFRVIAVVPKSNDGLMQQYLEDRGVRTYSLDVPQIVDYPLIELSRFCKSRCIAKRILFPIRECVSNARIARIIDREQVDLLHIGGAVIDVGYSAAIKRDVKIVWHLREFVELDHGLVYYDKRRAFLEYDGATACIAVSRTVRDYYKLKLTKVPIFTVYNGINTLNTQEEAIQSKIAENDRDCLRLVFLGGTSKTKGVNDVLNALQIVKSEGSSVSLDIYGKTNAVDWREFKGMLSSLGVSDIVRYMGWVSITTKLLSEYDALIVASRCEAFGRVTAEAMIGGLLVIGSDSGGTSELLAEGRGVLYESGNSDELARIIKSICIDRSRFSFCVDMAKEFAQIHFTTERYIDEVKDIYRQILF